MVSYNKLIFRHLIYSTKMSLNFIGNDLLRNPNLDKYHSLLLVSSPASPGEQMVDLFKRLRVTK